MTEATKASNVKIAQRYFQIEFMVRLFHLLKLLKCKEDLKPEDFLYHQVCNGFGQRFSDKVFDELESLSDELLGKVAMNCGEAIVSLLGKEEKVVIALDDIRVARAIEKDSFIDGFGLLEPISNAAWNFCKVLRGGYILAGTGAAKAHMNELRIHSNIGKTGTSKGIIFQDGFPPVTSTNISMLLDRLNLVELSKIEYEKLPINQTLQEEIPIADEVKSLLNAYVVDSRGRMLAGIVERIPTIYIEQVLASGALIFCNALLKCTKDHGNNLLEMLVKRIGPKSKNKIEHISQSIDFLQRAHIAASLTNGDMGLSHFPLDTEGDLVELGVAIVRSSPSVEDVPTFKITEKFVLETLERFFAEPDIKLQVSKELFDKNVKLLKNLVEKFGNKFQGKGNVLEYLLLDRLCFFGKGRKKLKDLSFIENYPDGWGDLIFKPTQIWEPTKNETTPSFLAQPKATDFVCSPEDVCRPDGIVMLDTRSGQKKAITFACAVYSNVVPTWKCLDQLFSSDFSRAYLTVDFKEYKQTMARLKEWREANLHETKSICLIVSLPGRQLEESGVKSAERVNMMKEDGSFSNICNNLYIHFDKTNIYKLLGTEKEAPAGLYDLLAYITNTRKDEWKGTTPMRKRRKEGEL